MPSPMPLVEPVTSETLPCRGAALLNVGLLELNGHGLFLSLELCEASFARLPARAEMPIGSAIDSDPLSGFRRVSLEREAGAPILTSR